MSGEPSGLARFARHRPITAFLIGALGIGLPLLVVPAIAGIPMMPFVLPMTYIGFLGSALVFTRFADGPGGVRQLLSRLLIWRFDLLADPRTSPRPTQSVLRAKALAPSPLPPLRARASPRGRRTRTRKAGPRA